MLIILCGRVGTLLVLYRGFKVNYKKRADPYFDPPLLQDLTNHSQKTLVCRIFT